jgi:hypothetical protein
MKMEIQIYGKMTLVEQDKVRKELQKLCRKVSDKYNLPATFEFMDSPEGKEVA